MKILKKTVWLAICLTVLLVAGCGERAPRTALYIETPRGLISFSRGYCELGMLITNDGINIRDENNIPITCSGYIKLTDEQAKKYGN